MNKPEDICKCGHDRACHPRKPCVYNWDGIENLGACRCEGFILKDKGEGDLK